MSSTPQQQSPSGARRIRVIVDDSPDSDGYPAGPSEPSIRMQRQIENLDAADIDRFIALFDNKEFQAFQEINRLESRIEILEQKDKVLTEALGL